MLQFLPVSEGNTLAVRATGKLTHEDYQTFLPQLEKQIEKIGKVSILFELENFVGWDLKAAKDDFSFGMKHLDSWDRLAVVGDKAWEHWMIAIAKPFLPTGELRYFDRDNLQEAWDWLREPEYLEQSSKQLRPYQSISVAFDFSLPSKHAVKRALELAKYYKVGLNILHVAQEIIPYPSIYGDGISGYVYSSQLLQEQNEGLVEQAKKQLDEYVKNLDSDVIIHTHVLSGETEKTILSFLEANNTDLAIFGAKKKKGFNKLLGSVPLYIQNHARCETLVVPLINTVNFQNKTQEN